MWEVQHFTLCDGWINCWTVEEEGAEVVPQTFPTRKDAGKYAYRIILDALPIGGELILFEPKERNQAET